LPSDTGQIVDLQATLGALSVASATDAWAVGVQYQNQNTVIATLAEHWNGKTWSVSPP
jgi:hypothetical protein